MNDNVQERWYRPVNRLGRITLIIAMAVSFLPFVYLYVKYGELPEGAVVLAAIGAMASAYFGPWFIEPISYFPALGTAGTYMGILAGSMAQMRVPAALVAKNVAGVEENTQEAEIVGTCGIAGSIYMNIIILTLTALGGSVLISMLPERVLAAMSTYVLPAIFGAILAMFTTKGRFQITLPAFLIAVGLGYLVVIGVYTIPSWTLIPVTVLLGVVIARVEYKMGWAK